MRRSSAEGREAGREASLKLRKSVERSSCQQQDPFWRRFRGLTAPEISVVVDLARYSPWWPILRFRRLPAIARFGGSAVSPRLSSATAAA